MPSSNYQIGIAPRTMVEDLMDLDDDKRTRQLQTRFIRKTVSPRSEGLMGQPPQRVFREPGPINNQYPMEARFRTQLPPRGPQVEEYQAPQISAAGVADRIFPSASKYIDALDDNEHPLHSVATSVLQNGGVNCTDKTIYIIIIAVLLLAVGCLLYKCLNNKA